MQLSVGQSMFTGIDELSCSMRSFLLPCYKVCTMAKQTLSVGDLPATVGYLTGARM